MSKIKLLQKITAMASFSLVIALVFSCSSTDVQEQPQQESIGEASYSSSNELSYSNSGEQQYWCVHSDLRACSIANSSTVCPNEGLLALNCPYSSNGNGGSSGSSSNPSSSSETVSNFSSSSSLVNSSSGISSSSSSSQSLSSGAISSSSSEPSSSSNCTAADNNETQYCSNGTMKNYGWVSHGGQTYKTVKIGNQTWMAENLNYNVTGSVCYDNNSSNCATYGRLYNWATAMNLDTSCNSNSSNSCSVSDHFKHQGICPSGWHIPTREEWSILSNSVSGRSDDLKATSGWNYNGSDTYGFAALPGGLGDSGGSFFNVGNIGLWWSASELSAGNAYYRYMYFNNEYVDTDSGSKSYLFSVRCLQD